MAAVAAAEAAAALGVGGDELADGRRAAVSVLLKLKSNHHVAKWL